VPRASRGIIKPMEQYPSGYGLVYQTSGTPSRYQPGTP
jgi:hypothetical protein